MMGMAGDAPEVRALLNPAFCGLLCRDSATGYSEERGLGMPYELAFLILPIVLHEETQMRLPKSIATKLHPWMQEHSYVRVGFERRAKAFTPYARRGLRYALRSGLIEMDQARALRPLTTVSRSRQTEHSEREATRKAAHFVGRWFARAGSPENVFATWGVRP